jgi:hypothetical protein
MAEDHDMNCQWMNADWHSGNEFVALALHLLTSMGDTNATGYPIVDCNIIDIEICVIKRCGLYIEEYKQWIT